MINGEYSHGDMQMFREIYDSLLTSNGSDRADTYFILQTSSPMRLPREGGGSLQRRGALGKDGYLNMACSGKFTSDRTIQQYVDEIWHLTR